MKAPAPSRPKPPENGQDFPVDATASILQNRAMVGKTQAPILPHLCNVQYMRTREKQYPISLPLGVDLTREANPDGLDQVFVLLVRTLFNYVLVGATIRALVSAVGLKALVRR